MLSKQEIYFVLKTLRWLSGVFIKMIWPTFVLLAGLIIGALPMIETIGMRLRFQEAVSTKVNPVAWHSAMMAASSAETNNVCYALELYNLDITDEYKHFRKEIDALRREIGPHREVDELCGLYIQNELSEKTCSNKPIASENLEFCMTFIQNKISGKKLKTLTPEQFYRIRSIHGSVHEHLLKESGMAQHELMAAYAMTTIESNKRLSHTSYIGAYTSMIPIGESCISVNSKICNIVFRKYN